MSTPTYQPPALVRFGSIESITGTIDKCWDVGWTEKGLGYPSDKNWKILPFCDLPDDDPISGV
jgi:hypothetical protein